MTKRANTTKCELCPLRKLAHFRAFTGDELAFMKSFKTGELNVEAGATIFIEKSVNLNLYTVLEGSGFRYKMLKDGRRQILNFILPGDLVGLEGTMAGEMQHSVEALSAMTLCAFDKSRLDTLFKSHPALAYDLTWIACREERLLDENLLTIGRRTSVERVAYALSVLYHRARQVGLAPGGKMDMPLTQTHLADALGLSLVHTNKTIRKLLRLGAVKWQGKGFQVNDAALLARAGGWPAPAETGRPFL
jgi:CRP/FNR family transcriptional regulator, anaerobic regulatory protein